MSIMYVKNANFFILEYVSNWKILLLLFKLYIIKIDMFFVNFFLKANWFFLYFQLSYL